ncbi:hypothetical protein GCM10009804_43960 [Kribbella hippodromi]|uniref:Uncharacterized protein n=1 Tax=Kribbella hippodromi TaxID=434347 RepID=A0ABN2DSA5_9ACTN
MHEGNQDCCQTTYEQSDGGCEHHGALADLAVHSAGYTGGQDGQGT